MHADVNGLRIYLQLPSSSKPLAADVGCYLSDCGLASNCFGLNFWACHCFSEGLPAPHMWHTHRGSGSLSGCTPAHTVLGWLAGLWGICATGAWCVPAGCLQPTALTASQHGQ
jgi:hypothetical protein